VKAEEGGDTGDGMAGFLRKGGSLLVAKSVQKKKEKEKEKRDEATGHRKKAKLKSRSRNSA